MECDSPPPSTPSLRISSSSAMIPQSERSSAFDLAEKVNQNSSEASHVQHEESKENKTPFEKSFNKTSNTTYSEMLPKSRKRLTNQIRAKGATLRCFRFLQQDIAISRRDMCQTGLYLISLYLQVLYMSSLQIIRLGLLLPAT